MHRLALVVCMGLAAAACGSGGEPTPGADTAATAGDDQAVDAPAPSSTSTSTTTTSTTTTTTTALAPDGDEPDEVTVTTTADEYVAILGKAIVLADDDFFGDDVAQAACLAEGVVAAVGVDHLRTIGDGDAVAAWFIDVPDAQFDEATAIGLGQALVDCMPLARELVAGELLGGSDQELSPEAHACVVDALEEATVLLIAEAFSAELLPLGLSFEEAEGVVAEILRCTPAVGDIFRDAILEGIALGEQLSGTEAPPAFVDCALRLIEDEVLGPLLRSTIMGTGRFEAQQLTQWIMVEAQTCWPPLPIVDIADVVGEYIVQGVNPGPPGTPYVGALTIAEGLGGISVMWDLGVVYTGRGELTPDGRLRVEFAQPVPGSGEWHLTQPGALVGWWAETGSEVTGTEVWTPVEAG